MKNIFTLLLTSYFSFAQLSNEINPNLLTKNWKASWISHPQASEKDYEALHFRKTFELKEKPTSFIVHVTADNRYWLFVNGERVCTGSSKGDLQHWQFESLDISKYLRSGTNTISTMVWNHGDYKAWWQQSYKTGFLMQGNSTKEEIINTNESWKVYQSHAYFPLDEDHRVIGAREYFFAEKNPHGWEKTDFNDSSWQQAKNTEIASPIAADFKSNRKLIQRTIPLPEEISQRFAQIRKMEGISMNDAFIKGKGNLEIYPWGNVTFLVDQNVLTTAYPELLLSGGKGTKITLTYLEAPFINVKTEHKGNRNEIEGKVISGIYDIILLDGTKNFCYRPVYYRTFRYIQVKIEAYNEPLVIHDFYSKFTGYPFKENATFTSSDTTLKSIWNTSWRTARLCAYETYMDCPYYEQMQYVGDTRIQALVSLYVSGDDKLIKNAINQYNYSRIPEGITESRSPNIQEQIIPPFSLFWVVMVHDFWWHKTDHAFVKSQLKGVSDVLAWFENKIDPNTGMLGKIPFWNFIDWPKEWPWTGQDRGSGMPKNSDNGGSSIHTLQFVYALEKAAELFESYDMKNEADRYKKIAQNLKIATYKNCWDENKKMVASVSDKAEFSQHANVMAVLTNMIEGDQAKDLMKRICADTSIVQCTVYYRFYLNQAMKKVGLGDEYIPMLTPWTDMLKLGLSTFAEKGEPSRSDCHAWSASPNYDLLASVIGIEPSSAGFKTITIKPNLGKLTFVEGSMPHPYGEVKVKLKRTSTKNEIEGSILLPKGTSGVFVWKGKKINLVEGQNLIKN